MKRISILHLIAFLTLCFALCQTASTHTSSRTTGAPATQATGKAPTTPAAVFIVNTADDHNDGSCSAGDCTLREAILAANANAGTDTINFAIGSAAQSIALNTPLPLISGTINLDATTQPGYAGVPLIEIYQVQPAPPAPPVVSDGLVVGFGATSSVIRGLILNRFKVDPQTGGGGGNALNLQANNCTIAGNFIGTDSAGNVALPNEASAIFINSASGSIIGGTGANDRNVLSGNFGDGVLLVGSAAIGNQIIGNFIGVNAAGNAALGNISDGIAITNGASNNIIGGVSPGERNVISANGNGIFIAQSVVPTSGNIVRGNYIGTDASGALALGNLFTGIDIAGATGNIIGGTASQGNVISGNDEGIRLSSDTATGNLIQGNLIGIASDGVSPLGNTFYGINIGFSAHDNLIGGLTGGLGNRIAFNGTSGFSSAGVIINTGVGPPARANAILGNSIYENVGNGIDLFPEGVTANDTGDSDSGANDLQNFPLITSAMTVAPSGNLNVQGSLGSVANSTFRLEFFASPTCDDSGNGEGRTFIGSFNVTTNGSGNVAFNEILPTGVPANTIITATATLLNPDTSPSSTSEFSPCVTSIGLTDILVEMTAEPSAVVVGSIIRYQIRVTTGAFDGAANVVVTDNLPATVTFISCGASGNSTCGGSGNNRTITFTSIAPNSVETITIFAQANCDVANNATITNAVAATTTTPETTTANNSASANVSVSNPGGSIMPTSNNFSASGGTGSINLTYPSGCSWTAISNDSWLAITSAASGTGDATIQYSVSSNFGAARTGTLTIAGLTFTVNQDAPLACTYTLTPDNASFDGNAATATFNVNTQSNCVWTAKSNNDWITVNPPAGGTGSGVVSYSITQNSTGTGRTGTITAGGQTFTITQTTLTAVKLIAFTATAYDDGVLLEWQTGQEVNNLGFHLYRIDGSERVRVTPEVISGSALLTGASAQLRAGNRYAWWDAQGKRISAYDLEDLDLDGTRTVHGATATSFVGGRPPQTTPAERLSRLGRTEPRIITPSTPEQQARRSVAADSARQTISRDIAAKAAIKIAVREAGWYQISRDELVAAGLDARANPRFLQLFAEGEEQAIHITGAEDGSFDATDRLEFYGTGLDTPATDRRIYWLVVGSQPGKRIALIKGEAKAGGESGFMTTVERRDHSIYFAALKNGDKENFFGAVVAGNTIEQTLPLQYPDTSTATMATLEVRLQGVTAAAHQVRVTLNGTTLGTITFRNQMSGAMQFTVPQALLREGTNTVLLTPLGGQSDVSLVDSLRISYRRLYMADNDSLHCSVDNQKADVQTITGFTSRAIRVLDISTPDNVRELHGNIEANDGTYRITVQTETAKTLLAFKADNVKRPVSVTANQPSHLPESDHSADLLLITHRDFVSSVAPLKDLREQQGFRVEVADIEDIYDEFNFGEKEPQAVKDFLAAIRTSWKQAPRFVLLVGSASYDSRNYLGAGDFDIMPTKLIDTAYLETASDDWFADFDNDGLAEMSVGRLPVRSTAEASQVVAKIVAYEASRQKIASRRSVLLVADKNDDFNFEQINTRLKNLLPPGTAVQEILRGRTDDTTAKRQLLEAIANGQTVINYNGHGSTGIWRSLLTTNDVQTFGNQQSPAFFVTMTCLNGYFLNALDESLAEALLKASGGAIAVWSSSGITDAGEQALMNQALFGSLFDNKLTLGEITRRAKQNTLNRDLRRTWILFGDPTTRLR